MMDFFYYASKYLLDKTIIALNGDIGNNSVILCVYVVWKFLVITATGHFL